MKAAFSVYYGNIILSDDRIIVAAARMGRMKRRSGQNQ